MALTGNSGKFLNSNFDLSKWNAAKNGKIQVGTKLKRDASDADNSFIIDAVDIDWGGLTFNYLVTDDNGNFVITTKSSGDVNEGKEPIEGIISTGQLLDLIGKSLESLGRRVNILSTSYIGDLSFLGTIENIINEIQTGEGGTEFLGTLIDKLKGLDDKTVIEYVKDYVDGSIKYDNGVDYIFVTHEELDDIIESTKSSLNNKINGVKSDMISLEQRLNNDISNITNENNIDIHYGDTSDGETENTLYINTNGSSSQSGNTPMVHKANVTINVVNGYSPSTQTVKVEEGKSATWSVYPSTGFKLPTTVTNDGTIYSNTVKSRKVTSADTSFTVTVECESLSDSSNTDELEDFTYTND